MPNNLIGTNKIKIESDFFLNLRLSLVYQKLNLALGAFVLIFLQKKFILIYIFIKNNLKYF